MVEDRFVWGFQGYRGGQVCSVVSRVSQRTGLFSGFKGIVEDMGLFSGFKGVIENRFVWRFQECRRGHRFIDDIQRRC